MSTTSVSAVHVFQQAFMDFILHFMTATEAMNKTLASDPWNVKKQVKTGVVVQLMAGNSIHVLSYLKLEKKKMS